MKKLSSIILVTLILLSAINLVPRVFALEDYDPKRLPSLVGEFPVSYEVLDTNKSSCNTDSVSGINIIKISAGEQEGPFGITVYLNRGFMTHKENVRLPFELKWNFSGLLDGPYEMLLVVRNTGGKIGVARIKFTVKH